MLRLAATFFKRLEHVPWKRSHATSLSLCQASGRGRPLGNGLGGLMYRFSPSSVAAQYRSLLRRRPYCAGFAVCFGNGLLADLISQYFLERKKQLEPRRTLAVAIFSGAFCGCAYHWIFNVLYTRMYGTATSAGVVVAKTFTDGFVSFPFLYMPCFFVCDEIIRFGRYDSIFSRWQSEIPDVMKDYFKIWPFANLLVFSVVPPALRTTFMASVSFCWLVMLSFITQRKSTTTVQVQFSSPIASGGGDHVTLSEES